MNLLKSVASIVFLFMALVPEASSAAAAPTVKDMIAAANKEGVLEFYAPTQVEERGARRLNAAEFVGHTSAFISGTRANKYVQNKRVLYMAQSQAEMIDRLTREYTKLLGMK